MKVFSCIIDNGETLSKRIICAESKKELFEIHGRIQFEKVEDITKTQFEHPNDFITKTWIALNCQKLEYSEMELIEGLLKAHFKKNKISL